MGRGQGGGVGRVAAVVTRCFLPLLVGAYALAAAWPAPGAAVRHTEVLSVAVSGVGGVTVTLPVLLLAGLLFNAGLAADVTELAGMVRRPGAVLAGMAANALVPVGLLALLSAGLRLWPDPDEGRCLLIGLGVVAAMPIAGSSAAWSQAAGGSAALSLGLVVLTTVLSPVVTPLTLAAVGPLAGGAGLVDGAAVPGFLAAGVVLPSVAGMAVRAAVGRALVAGAYPWLKLGNAAVLLTLCYANATAALPAVAADPDWDYLALVVAASVALSGAGFLAGWGVARGLRADGPQTRSLVFALGMSNNGTGLVLAGAALAGSPAAAVPVLAYNLVQHLVAGVAARALAPAPAA